LRALLASASIVFMAIPLRTAGAKAPSKFHGPFHEQVRQQAEKRRLEAFRLYLDGKPVGEIADALGVDCSTVWRYIHHENRACRVAMAERVMVVIEQQSNVLGRVVNQAWSAWESSCQTGTRRIRVTDRQGPNGRSRETTRQVERGPGDARFLDVIRKALADIRALYGMGAGESGRQTDIFAQAAGDRPIILQTRWGVATDPQSRPSADVAHRDGEAGQNADGATVVDGDNDEQANEGATVSARPKKPVG
jgi:hypothetical protein